MLKLVVQSNVIHSFKSTSTNEIYEKWGNGTCEVGDEHFNTELSVHECNYKGFSLHILHQGMNDELIAIAYHETTEVEEIEEGKDNPDLKVINLKKEHAARGKRIVSRT